MLDKNHVAILSERPRRSAMISVRLTQDERQLITTFASQHNIQISRLVRAESYRPSIGTIGASTMKQTEAVQVDSKIMPLIRASYTDEVAAKLG